MKNPLCPYKNIFGAPKTGIHSIRFCNVAVVDVIGTVLVSYAIARLTKWNFMYVVLIAFIIAIVAHRLFCVRTTFDKLIFPDSMCPLELLLEPQQVPQVVHC